MPRPRPRIAAHRVEENEGGGDASSWPRPVPPVRTLDHGPESLVVNVSLLREHPPLQACSIRHPAWQPWGSRRDPVRALSDQSETALHFFRDVLQRTEGEHPHDPVLYFFDVGAHIGRYTLLVRYLQNLHRWRVVAFEPSAEAQLVLRYHVSLNNLEEHVTVVPDAVGEQYADDQVLSIPREHALAALTTHRGAGRRVVVHRQEHVRVVTLDDYCVQHSIPRVHVLKVDTNGSEYDVLCGAQRILTRDRPCVVYPAVGETVKAMQGALGPHGVTNSSSVVVVRFGGSGQRNFRGASPMVTHQGT